MPETCSCGLIYADDERLVYVDRGDLSQWKSED